MSRPEAGALHGGRRRGPARLEEWDERLARLEGVLAQVATQDVHGVDPLPRPGRFEEK
jgi:hypothetical protein